MHLKLLFARILLWSVGERINIYFILKNDAAVQVGQYTLHQQFQQTSYILAILVSFVSGPLSSVGGWRNITRSYASKRDPAEKLAAAGKTAAGTVSATKIYIFVAGTLCAVGIGTYVSI